MAIAGAKPVFCVYSSFLQRAYDQLLHDVCLQGLHVVFGIDRAGLVGADGETHHGIYDISYLLSLPNMTVLSPSSAEELRASLRYAAGCEGPCAIRYNRGVLPERPMSGGILSWECIKPFRSVCVVATGRTVKNAAEACEGLNVGLWNARSIRPMDEEALASIARAHYVFTVEDGVKNAGFGAAVAAYLSEHGSGASVIPLGVPNRVIEQGSVAEQDEECGLSAEEIKRAVSARMGGIYA
jgi:1-deoxy-D-xylulose-5-phosphate synthase